MKRRSLRTFFALFTVLALVVGVAGASNKKEQIKDRDDHHQWRDRDDHHREVRHVSDHDADDHHHGSVPHYRDGDHDRDDHWARSGYRNGIPPGWGHGQKKGWSNCDMPPGQAKKYGCTTYVYQGRQYEVFHDEDGHYRWRPHVSAHGSVDVNR